MMIGGIDLGGTKIEARVFDDRLTEIVRHRIATPSESYPALLDAITRQVHWIAAQGDVSAIGLGAAGVINPRNGVFFTANLPASGHPLAHDLARRVNRPIPVINDCRAFTLSEAIAGAGKNHQSIIGLAIGTGVAGGHAINQRLIPDMNGQHAEFGHLPLPAPFIDQYNLPLMRCKCGLTGCFETYLSGSGLIALGLQMTGASLSTHDIVKNHPDVRAAWVMLAASLIAIICRTSDPDMIVLGGGLGMITGLPDEIRKALPPLLLAQTTAPAIVQAQHGDASGALGAALYAQQSMTA